MSHHPTHGDATAMRTVRATKCWCSELYKPMDSQCFISSVVCLNRTGFHLGLWRGAEPEVEFKVGNGVGR